jgi:hypothetical protein
MDQGKSHLPHFVQKSKVYNALLSNNTIFIMHYYLTIPYHTIPYHTIPYYIYLVYKIIIKLNFFQVEKGNTGFFPTRITGVIAHGEDLKMCFIDQLKWPADANVTINILVTVLKFIKDKVVVYSIV